MADYKVIMGSEWERICNDDLEDLTRFIEQNLNDKLQIMTDQEMTVIAFAQQLEGECAKLSDERREGLDNITDLQDFMFHIRAIKNIVYADRGRRTVNDIKSWVGGK